MADDISEAEDDAELRPESSNNKHRISVPGLAVEYRKKINTRR